MRTIFIGIMVYLYSSMIRSQIIHYGVWMKLKVKILGTGCTKCKTLEEIVREIVQELELNAEIVKVTDINKIIEYGVMLTPGLIIDEKVVISGRLPSREEVEDLLRSAAK